MTTVFTNGDFISLNNDGMIYSVMVVHNKDIEYIGYNTPICYDSERVVDLEGKAVIPLANDLIKLDRSGAVCNILEAGQRADFAILDKNILKEPDARVLEIYIKGKKK